jgi:predicted lipid-binding transport protein (Tim44 family)
VASPDTDELATIPVPLPAGAPDAETAPQERVGAAEVASPGGPGAQAVPQERVEPERVEPAAAAAEDSPEHDAEPAKQGGRWWRGFTGSLAAGLVVLAIGVLVVAGVCLYTGVPGPGAVLLVGHPIAAVLALLAQRVADRRNGAAAVGGGVAVVLFTVSALTLFWLT